MYVLARDVKVQNVTIRKGTRLSDVYDGGPDDRYYAIAHPASGGRIKLTLDKNDIVVPIDPTHGVDAAVMTLRNQTKATP